MKAGSDGVSRVFSAAERISAAVRVTAQRQALRAVMPSKRAYKKARSALPSGEELHADAIRPA